MSTMTGTALAVDHFLHHAADASGGDMALLADLGALPLCRDSAPSDRITDLASIKE